ncbi:unnamed protein product [Onchocerca flexuosa]|uniref:ShKT domain-containing protein n=1 Tax=Onchocerca flexuosa TaxID=387005 RepID=A0A183I5J9_9BILA|nr:unnamed protein product [Onchocerca flexuosa]
MELDELKCRDISIFCNITTLNICGRPDLSKYCHKTCNLCSDVTTTTTTTTTPSSQDCLDQWTNCTVLEPVVCLNDSDIATTYCSKTCNNCMATTTVEPSAATQFNSWLAIFYFILFFATTKLLA